MTAFFVLQRRRLAAAIERLINPSIGAHALVALAVLYWHDEIEMQGILAKVCIAILIPCSWMVPSALTSTVGWLRASEGDASSQREIEFKQGA